MAPAVWDVADYWRYRDVPGTPPVARWALALLWLSLLQGIYGLYLALTPHWTSAWVVTIAELVLAAIYSLLLGLFLMASPSGWWAGPSGWQLGARLANGQAVWWCLCLASISAVLAFFGGRLSWQWHRTDELLRRAAR